jgi:hypothetical protein
MDSYRKELEYLVREDPDISCDPQWQQFSDGLPPVKPRSATILYTASWSQDAPYNNRCPVLPKGRAVTGCVATSMAIVMKYHADREYAAYGTGSHSYSDDGMTHSVDFGAYDWANMPDRTEDFTSDTQREAVARLMYHCAVSVESDFEADGTGTYNWNTSVALTSFFGFDGRLNFIEKSDYTDSEWKSLIRNEIDAERPVIYDGVNIFQLVGHSFVLSGYSDDDMFFFNWGWGGTYNGWFALSALTPGYGHNYSSYQGMITGIRRADGEPFSGLRFVKGNASGSDGVAMTGSGNSFVIYGGMFENRSYRPFSGSIGVALTDAGGNIREIIGSIDNFQLERGYAWSDYKFIGNIYCTVTAPYSVGDRIRFVSSEDGRQTWQTIYGAPGVATEVSVGNKAITSLPPPSAVHVYGTPGGITVNSPRAEQIAIYSTGGQLLYRVHKPAGIAAFNLNGLPRGALIVRGSSGWTEKAINN